MFGRSASSCRGKRIATENPEIEALPADRTLTLGLIGAARVAYRGHDTLIRVMAKLRRAGYDVRVRFLGDDKGKESHIAVAEREGVAEYVSFDGYRTQEGVFEWIDGIDILVMPTLSETLGRAVIEAMSRGCPVIGSAETALPEQIGRTVSLRRGMSRKYPKSWNI